MSSFITSKLFLVINNLHIFSQDKILATLGEGTFGKVVKVKELET